jgi:hypothetical protein
MPSGGARPGSGRKPAPGISLREARRRKEEALAGLRQLELQRKRREWDDELIREMERAIREVRNALLALPARLGMRLGLTREQVHLWDQEVRRALESLADFHGGETASWQ